MKHFFSLLFLLLIGLGSLSGEIAVKSFRKLESDLDARLHHQLKDQNGDPCAIIKVVTTQKGFSFDGGTMGIIKTIEKPSEIWVYVPWGIKRISIFHPQLGQLRDYMISMSVEKATVYELVITTGRVTTIVEETIESQWLVITPDPADAAIYMDDIYIKNGVHQAKMKPGNYTYRVEAPLYHTEVGLVEISNAKKVLNIKLKPNFGYITVNSTPESGAQVFIDDKPLSKFTPMTTEALKSGEYTLKVMKEMYQPFSQKVLVNDAQTSTINAVLQPNFAVLSLNAPQNAELYINNEKKGNGAWKGRLQAGVFTVEAKLAKHRDAKQDIELNIGEVRTVNLQPTPIYGSLDVITDPPGARISIDGREYGATPNTINNLLIGNYTVNLTKTGFSSVKKTVTIVERENTELIETLSESRATTSNVQVVENTQSFTKHPVKKYKPNRSLAYDYYLKYPFTMGVGYIESAFMNAVYMENVLTNTLQNKGGLAYTISANLFPFKLDLIAFMSNYDTNLIQQHEKLSHEGVEIAFSYNLLNLNKYAHLYLGTGFQFSQLHTKIKNDVTTYTMNTSTPIGKGGVYVMLGSFAIYGELVQSFLATNKANYAQLRVGAGFNF